LTPSKSEIYTFLRTKGVLKYFQSSTPFSRKKCTGMTTKLDRKPILFLINDYHDIVSVFINIYTPRPRKEDVLGYMHVEFS
jgi:hypothetical protein